MNELFEDTGSFSCLDISRIFHDLSRISRVLFTSSNDTKGNQELRVAQDLH